MFLLKDTKQWRWWGSNPWPLGHESSTLPLSHCSPNVGGVSVQLRRLLRVLYTCRCKPCTQVFWKHVSSSEYLHFDTRWWVPDTLPSGKVGIHVLFGTRFDYLHPFPSENRPNMIKSKSPTIVFSNSMNPDQAQRDITKQFDTLMVILRLTYLTVLFVHNVCMQVKIKSVKKW